MNPPWPLLLILLVFFINADEMFVYLLVRPFLLVRACLHQLLAIRHSSTMVDV